MGRKQDTSSPRRWPAEASNHHLLSMTPESLNEFRQLETGIQERLLEMVSAQQSADNEARRSNLRTEHVLGLQPFDVEKKRLNLRATGIRWGALLSTVSIAASAYAAAAGATLGLSIGCLVFAVPATTVVVRFSLQRRRTNAKQLSD